MYHLLPYLNCVCCWCLGIYLCDKIQCHMYPKDKSVSANSGNPNNNKRKCTCETDPESEALLPPPTYNEVIIYHQPGAGVVSSAEVVGNENVNGNSNHAVETRGYLNHYDDLVNPGTCLNASSSPVTNFTSAPFYYISKSN